MSYFKYCPDRLKVAESILGGQGLLFPGFRSFNDPFEPALIWQRKPEDRAIFAQIQKGAFTKFLRDSRLNSVSKKALKRLKHETLHAGSAQRITREIPDDFNRDFGILCLTKDPRNLLMWAHYANSHRGFVLEFDEADPLFSSGEPKDSDNWHPALGRPIDVTYQANRPMISVQHADIRQLFCTKAPAWSYEQEVRIVRRTKFCDTRSDDGLAIFRFQPASLKRIIFGNKVEREFMDHVVALSKQRRGVYPSIKYARINLSTQSYSLEIDAISPPAPGKVCVSSNDAPLGAAELRS